MSFRITAVLASVALCAFSVIVPVQAATYTLQPDEAASKDTFAYSFIDQPLETAFGGAYKGILGTANTPSGHNVISLIQFDLTSLSSAGVVGDDVTSAKLKLRATQGNFSSSPSVDYPVTVDLSANGASWDEDTVKWSTLPPAGGGVISSTVVNNDTDWFEFDVFSLVEGWLNGGDNFGLRLTQGQFQNLTTGANLGTTFFSSSGGAADRPILEITTVPEPSGLFLLASAGLLAMRFRKRR